MPDRAVMPMANAGLRMSAVGAAITSSGLFDNVDATSVRELAAEILRRLDEIPIVFTDEDVEAGAKALHQSSSPSHDWDQLPPPSQAAWRDDALCVLATFRGPTPEPEPASARDTAIAQLEMLRDTCQFQAKLHSDAGWGEVAYAAIRAIWELEGVLQ